MTKKPSPTDSILEELRAFGLAYPGAHTKSPWPGHLDLAVKDKTFAYLSLEGEPLGVGCKLPRSNAMALMLPFCTPMAYGLGKSGWVSASFEGVKADAIDVDMLKAWIDESYRAQAPKKLVAQLTTAPSKPAAEQAGAEQAGAEQAAAEQDGEAARQEAREVEAMMDARARIEEVFLAPVGTVLESRDTRIIERADWYQTITPSSTTSLGNEVVFSRLDAAAAEDVLRRTIREYAAYGRPFKWCTGPLTEPADFGALLDRYGFVGWDVRGMAIDPATWPFGSGAVGPIAIDLVTRENIDDYIDGFERGWDVALERASHRDDLLRALETGRFHMFIARVEGAVAGTAGYIVKPRSAYLVGGNVLAAHRGRGAYRALIEERLRRLRAAGVSLATTQAREATSAPILERLGFESVYRGRIYRLDDPRAAVARFAIEG